MSRDSEKSSSERSSSGGRSVANSDVSMANSDRSSDRSMAGGSRRASSVVGSPLSSGSVRAESRAFPDAHDTVAYAHEVTDGHAIAESHDAHEVADASHAMHEMTNSQSSTSLTLLGMHATSANPSTSTLLLTDTDADPLADTAVVASPLAEALVQEKRAADALETVLDVDVVPASASKSPLFSGVARGATPTPPSTGDSDDSDDDGVDLEAMNERERDRQERHAAKDEPSTRAEMLAWINYDWSSTVFSSVAMAVFVPLILEQLASEVGRVPGTENTPCSRPSNTAVGQDPPPCEVWFGPAGYVPTVSFALYITTIAVAFQTVTYISLGALADYGNNRKVFLVTFAVAGALLTIGMLGVVNPQMYWLAAMLVIMANICYGCTLIFYNSYLPVLVHNHPAVRARAEEPVEFDAIEQEIHLLGFTTFYEKLAAQSARHWKSVRSRVLPRRPVAPEVAITVEEPCDETAIATSASSDAADDQTGAGVDIASEKPSEKPRRMTLNSNRVHADSVESRADSFGTDTPRRESSRSIQHPIHPALLHHSPSVRAQDVETASAISAAARNRVQNQTRLEDRLANALSTHGLASGQVASLIMFGMSAAITAGFGDNVYGMQVIVGVAGIWWLLFSCITWYYLKARPGPPMPKKAGNPLLFSWRKTFHSIGRARRLNNTFLYLLSYFIFQNTFATIGSLAILFAKKTIRMSTSQLSVALVLAPIAAISGVYFWLWVSRRFNLSTKTVLLILLSLANLLPVYGLLGYIPNTNEIVVVPGSGPNNAGQITIGFGLKTIMEMYIVVCFFGFVLGAVQSFGRVLYTDLLPRKHEAEFFALAEICVRGTSWVGTLIVGAIANSTGGDLRPGFVYIIVMLTASIAILWRFVDVTQGRRECERFVHEEEMKRKQREESKRQKKMAKKNAKRARVKTENSEMQQRRLWPRRSQPTSPEPQEDVKMSVAEEPVKIGASVSSPSLMELKD